MKAINPFVSLESLTLYFTKRDTFSEATFDLGTYGLWPLKYTKSLTLHISNPTYKFIVHLFESLKQEIIFRQVPLTQIIINLELISEQSLYFGNFYNVLEMFSLAIHNATEVIVNGFSIHDVLRSMLPKITAENTKMDSVSGFGISDSENENESEDDMSSDGTDGEFLDAIDDEED